MEKLGWLALIRFAWFKAWAIPFMVEMWDDADKLPRITWKAKYYDKMNELVGRKSAVWRADRCHECGHQMPIFEKWP